MLRSEFETMTGIYPTLGHYAIIGQHYKASDVQKDTFCDAYKKNVDGLAEKIQAEADAAEQEERKERADLEERMTAELEQLENRIARLQEELERQWRLGKSSEPDSKASGQPEGMPEPEPEPEHGTRINIRIELPEYSKERMEKRLLEYAKKIARRNK